MTNCTCHLSHNIWLIHIDVDECGLEDVTTCADSADCSNVVGGFSCTCIDGYVGNGLSCGMFIVLKC